MSPLSYQALDPFTFQQNAVVQRVHVLLSMVCYV
jgi:hypothetical protein